MATVEILPSLARFRREQSQILSIQHQGRIVAAGSVLDRERGAAFKSLLFE